MIKKSYKIKQTLPATEFSPSQCDYGEAADSLPAHQHTSGRGKQETPRLTLVPFPPEEEEEARKPSVWWRCQWEPCRRLVVKGSFQLASYSFVAECV